MPTSKPALKPTHEVVLDDLDQLLRRHTAGMKKAEQLVSILQRSKIPTDDLLGMIKRLDKMVETTPQNEPMLRSLLQRLKREYADHIR